jgi:predicted nucleic acid-binding protein
VRLVLVDTGAIYAFVRATDANHRRAATFIRACLDERTTLLLPDLVFAETMTLLKSRAGPLVAIETGRALRRSPLYRWEPLGPDGERLAWDLFQRHDDKLWSYTDCAVLALAQRHRIGEVFAFDTHFDQMPGLRRVPDTP